MSFESPESPRNFDISSILDKWDYKPGQVEGPENFGGKDGLEKNSTPR